MGDTGKHSADGDRFRWMDPGHRRDGRDLRRLWDLYDKSDDKDNNSAAVVAIETLLAGGANLNPPCYVADRALSATIRQVYATFWEALAAFDDAHQGTLNAVSWPPTPAGVLAAAARVEYDAMGDAPVGPPYTRESAAILSAAALAVLPVIAARVRSGRA